VGRLEGDKVEGVLIMYCSYLCVLLLCLSVFCTFNLGFEHLLASMLDTNSMKVARELSMQEVRIKYVTLQRPRL
jgi:hypothetical protein